VLLRFLELRLYLDATCDQAMVPAESSQTPSPAALLVAGSFLVVSFLNSLYSSLFINCSELISRKASLNCLSRWTQ
jgi:hypothetical protein